MSVAESPTGTQWWRHAVVYQIYPRSFADGNGDGIGDLPGITSRLHSLTELGVDAIWLSPFYRSPQADAGYDVADYCDVDPLFGTLDDFDAMLARASELNLQVIVDLVPNHTSDEHPWFTAALAAPAGSSERGRYLFRDGVGPGGDLPPNNWMSVFGGPAWTRIADADGNPGQWYLHIFDVKQPDLDWTNPEVRQEFHRILRFWLDRGVAGFRVDVAHGLVKADGLPDQLPGAERSVMALTTPAGDAMVHSGPATAMWDQDGVHEIYRGWRDILNSYGGDPMMVAEAWVSPLERMARYVRADEMQQAFNFDYLATPLEAQAVRAVIDSSLAATALVGAPTTWVLSNHDVVRHVSRFGLADVIEPHSGIGADDEQPDFALGLRRARAATLLMLGLPGSAYLYQGEELGLPDHTALDDHLRQDPGWVRSGRTQRGRDGCRVPIPWESGAPGLGFGPNSETWLPQPDSYAALARDRQQGLAGSTLELYRSALATRRDHRLGLGQLRWAAEMPSGVVAYTNGSVGVVANLGADPVGIPDGKVLVCSGELTADGRLPADTTVWIAH
ncbi:MAG: glycoside hydrolase family 13 protein [Actinomycetota bacterium]|nr:glycoside hydrolase family 13 protein [Actinomycetota bacterium]